MYYTYLDDRLACMFDDFNRDIKFIEEYKQEMYYSLFYAIKGFN